MITLRNAVLAGTEGIRLEILWVGLVMAAWGNHSILTDGNHNHSIDFYAHRHFIKLRATSSSGAHTHTIADHTHTLQLNGGNMLTGSAGTETRPDNVAVIFWRRTN
ncbi:MAG: hypothetical protein IPN22_00930 [Bacteroidetes bacterium]|nr:hypothetical protein [Bacteroidota bacterium]